MEQGWLHWNCIHFVWFTLSYCILRLLLWPFPSNPLLCFNLQFWSTHRLHCPHTPLSWRQVSRTTFARLCLSRNVWITTLCSFLLCPWIWFHEAVSLLYLVCAHGHHYSLGNRSIQCAYSRKMVPWSVWFLDQLSSNISCCRYWGRHAAVSGCVGLGLVLA